ncbi:MAG: DUF1858 domain-containing protein [Candidatus Micrarchaeota archaeon]
MTEITMQTRIKELAQNHPDALVPLMELGFHCFGCPAAGFETIEQGCRAHGLTDEQIDELLKKINEAVSKAETH